MTTTEKVVRDFIYLDVERLYSLYSQLFEGVTEGIVHSIESSNSAMNEQKGGMLSGERVESAVLEHSRKTENRILHDEMYNRLELRIGAEQIDVTNVAKSDLLSWRSKTPYIKVSGIAEIEDYERIKAYLDNFNGIAEAIAYSTIVSEGNIPQQVSELKVKVEEIKNRNERARAKEKLKTQTEPKRLAREKARELGLLQDESLLSHLKFFCEFFGSGAFDITVTPHRDVPEFAVRARTDRRWLRLTPEMLRSLYGCYSEQPWSIVGQVTCIPNEAPLPQVVATDGSQVEAQPSLRDPLRNMFLSTHVFERMFMASNQRFEIIVHPLAIYREYKIPVVAERATAAPAELLHPQ